MQIRLRRRIPKTSVKRFESALLSDISDIFLHILYSCGLPDANTFSGSRGMVCVCRMDFVELYYLLQSEIQMEVYPLRFFWGLRFGIAEILKLSGFEIAGF